MISVGRSVSLSPSRLSFNTIADPLRSEKYMYFCDVGLFSEAYTCDGTQYTTPMPVSTSATEDGAFHHFYRSIISKYDTENCKKQWHGWNKKNMTQKKTREKRRE